MILANQKMEMALGLPVLVSGFNDGKVRACYPFKLRNITVLNLYLSSISQTDLYENFKDQVKTEYMAALFTMSFKPKDDEELDILLHSIDANNFAEIINDIKTVSGIVDSKGEVDISKTKNTLDWNTAINSIPIYSSTPHDKVKELTLTQFNMTLKLIGKKINYQYKSNTLGLVKEPSKYITEQDHPLYGEIDSDKKHITMDDIKGIMEMQNQ